MRNFVFVPFWNLLHGFYFHWKKLAPYCHLPDRLNFCSLFLTDPYLLPALSTAKHCLVNLKNWFDVNFCSLYLIIWKMNHEVRCFDVNMKFHKCLDKWRYWMREGILLLEKCGIYLAPVTSIISLGAFKMELFSSDYNQTMGYVGDFHHYCIIVVI